MIQQSLPMAETTESVPRYQNRPACSALAEEHGSGDGDTVIPGSYMQCATVVHSEETPSGSKVQQSHGSVVGSISKWDRKPRVQVKYELETLERLMEFMVGTRSANTYMPLTCFLPGYDGTGEKEREISLSRWDYFEAVGGIMGAMREVINHIDAEHLSEVELVAERLFMHFGNVLHLIALARPLKYCCAYCIRMRKAFAETADFDIGVWREDVFIFEIANSLANGGLPDDMEFITDSKFERKLQPTSNRGWEKKEFCIACGMVGHHSQVCQNPSATFLAHKKGGKTMQKLCFGWNNNPRSCHNVCGFAHRCSVCGTEGHAARVCDRRRS